MEFKDNWDKAEILSKVLLPIVIPLSIFYYSNAAEEAKLVASYMDRLTSKNLIERAIALNTLNDAIPKRSQSIIKALQSEEIRQIKVLVRELETEHSSLNSAATVIISDWEELKKESELSAEQRQQKGLGLIARIKVFDLLIPQSQLSKLQLLETTLKNNAEFANDMYLVAAGRKDALPLARRFVAGVAFSSIESAVNEWREITASIESILAKKERPFEVYPEEMTKLLISLNSRVSNYQNPPVIYRVSQELADHISFIQGVPNAYPRSK